MFYMYVLSFTESLIGYMWAYILSYTLIESEYSAKHVMNLFFHVSKF